MAFVLSTSDDQLLTDPSAEALENVIANLPDGDDSFAILAVEGDELTFMQAIGGPSVGFTLEYQDGSLDQHFMCEINPLPTEHVVMAFRAYSRHDDVWKTAFTWERLAL